MPMDRQRLLEHKLRNNLQLAALLFVLAALMGYLAWVVGGEPFLWGALLGVALLYVVNPVGSPRLVLGLYGARAIDPADAPELYSILLALARRAGLERLPRLYWLPSRVLNAFATGHRSDAAVALSDGMLRRLDPREIAGVLAHEIGHIANGDLRVLAFADTVSRITGILGLAGQLLLILSIPMMLFGLGIPPAGAILVLLLGPSLSALVQLALSRNREYEADRTAAELSGDPVGLASALERLERYQGSFWEQLVLPGRNLPAPSILRTHPPTAERVRRLLELVTSVSRLPADGLFRDPLIDSSARHGGTRHPRWHLSGLWY